MFTTIDLPRILIITAILLSLSFPAGGEMRLDGTAGPLVELTGPDFEIGEELGRLAGGNLFHSFSEFNILEGESATFSGADTIANIITRVTGGNRSRINGRISSSIPGADFFLLNPAGVIFGANASLDLSGAFYVSTADRLDLGNGGYYLLDPAGDSHLTVDAPESFGFLGEPASGITIKGSTLQVPDGKSISMVGGPFQMEGGNLIARSGRIGITSVADSGKVSLDGDIAGTLSGIDIKSDAYLSTSGNSAGEILIRGGDLSIQESYIYSSSYGDTEGGLIDLCMDGAFTMSGGSEVNASAYSLANGAGINVSAESIRIGENCLLGTYSDYLGNAGEISLTAGNLFIENGGRIVSDTAGFAHGGKIDINVTGTIQMDGIEENVFLSGIRSVTQSASGNAGDIHISAAGIRMEKAVIDNETLTPALGHGGTITVETGYLDLSKGALITGSSRSSGEGGDINIRASGIITVTDDTTAIQSDAAYLGKAGKINLEAGELTVKNGAMIQARTYSSGNGGNICINAEKVGIEDGGQINSDVMFFAGGKGGDITIHATESINIDNRSETPLMRSSISADTLGSGDAGKIDIKTPCLTLRNGWIEGGTYDSGRAGDIHIDVGQMSIMDRGTIESNTFTENSSGKGGNITVAAQTAILVTGNTEGDPDSAGMISTSTLGFADGGTVYLQSPDIKLDNGIIAALSDSDGNAGKVDIKGGTISLTNRGMIVTGVTGKGIGGNIAIEGESVNITNSGAISAKSVGSGNAGTISLNVQDSVTVMDGSVTAEAESSDGGDITLNAGRLVHLSGGKVTAVVGGGGETTGGNISIDPEFVILNNSRIVANAYEGKGGSIDIEAENFMKDSGSVISASSELGIDGSVDIDATMINLSGIIPPLTGKFRKNERLLSAPCAERMKDGNTSTFYIGGSGWSKPGCEPFLPSPLFDFKK